MKDSVYRISVRIIIVIFFAFLQLMSDRKLQVGGFITEFAISDWAVRRRSYSRYFNGLETDCKVSLYGFPSREIILPIPNNLEISNSTPESINIHEVTDILQKVLY